jgi:hypothetical protein
MTDLGPVTGDLDVRFEKPGELQARIRRVMSKANPRQLVILETALTRRSSGNLTLQERWLIEDLEEEQP